MSHAAEKIKTELVRLSPADRTELVHFLIETLDQEQEPAVQAAWDAELRRRLGEIESGKVKGIPAEDVFDEMRKQYP